MRKTRDKFQITDIHSCNMPAIVLRNDSEQNRMSALEDKGIHLSNEEDSQ